MDDLISRQALMKEFADFVRASNNSDFAKTPTWNDAVSLVGSMPSAQPEKTLLTVKCELDEELRRAIEDVKNAELELIAAQQEQRWIPVSERLPEERQDVLVCTKYQGITDGMHECGTWWIAWGDRCYEDEENLILAWMPLPEPYKETES